MSISCSNYCFSDLLCTEESESELFANDLTFAQTFPGINSLMDVDESLAGLIEDEKKYLPGIEYLKRCAPESVQASVREKSIQWTLKAKSHFGFQPMTAYLAISYFDRFLSCRGFPPDSSDGWHMQLLSIACVSLAAKMEEIKVPTLPELQLEELSLTFESNFIERMEIMILRTLDWRLRSVTPFHFITIFAYKLDSAGCCIDFLIARSTDLIFSNIQDANLVEYLPSCIAAAAILFAAEDIPRYSFANVEHALTWCDGLEKDKIESCYNLIETKANANRPVKRLKVIPQVRIMGSRARARPTGDLSSLTFSF